MYICMWFILFFIWDDVLLCEFFVLIGYNCIEKFVGFFKMGGKVFIWIVVCGIFL